MEAWRREAFGTRSQYQPIEILEVDNRRISGLSGLLKGYDLEQQCYVTIHQVDAALAADATFRQNFTQCMDRSRDLDDVNVLRILDYAHEDTRCYVVTNWVEGSTLHNVLADLTDARQRPGLLDVIEIVQQVGGALETLYLNSQWTHAVNLQTVKLVRPARRSDHYWAMLTDLGLVGMAGAALKPFDYVGQELAWLAPERYINRQPYTEHTFDPPGDVYALGVLFYQLLLGKPPFEIQKVEEGEGYFKIDPAVRHIEIRPAPPRLEAPDFPRPLEQVLLKALSVKPEKRYASPRDLMVDLARALAQASGAYVLRQRPVSLVATLPYPADLAEPESSQSLITVDKPRIKVVPGSTETVNVTVANPTNQVDRFQLWAEEGEVPKEWYTIVAQNNGSAAIGQEARFVLTIRPPQDIQRVAGNYSLKLIAQSKLRFNAEVATRELVLAIDRVVAYQVEEIAPIVLRARNQGVIGVKNLGNVRETFRFTWRSEENSVEFDPPTALVIVDPWQTATVPFRATPHTTPWFGRSNTHKISTQVDVLKAGKLEVRKAEVRAYSTFPWRWVVFSLLTLLVILLVAVWSYKPVVSVYTPSTGQPDICKDWLTTRFNGPALPICIKTEQVQNSSLFAETWSSVIGLPASIGLVSSTPKPPPLPEQNQGSKKYGAHVKSLTLLLNQPQKIEIPITQTITFTHVAETNILTDTYISTTKSVTTYYAYAYQSPDVASRMDRPYLIARNWLGEQSWLGPLSWLGASYYPLGYNLLPPVPTSTPTVVARAQITRFCVNTEPPRPQPVCTFDNVAPATLPLVFGDTPTLTFSWEVANAPDSTPDLAEATQVDAVNRTALAPAPIEGGMLTYTLQIRDLAGNVQSDSKLLVETTKIACTVATSLLNIPLTNGQLISQPVTLRKSPGIDYEILGQLDLDPDRQIILRSAPIDYAQNSDVADWVEVQIQGTNEAGWVNYCGLQCGGYLSETCQRLIPPGATVLPLADDSSTTQGAAGVANPTAAAAEQVAAVQAATENLPKPAAPQFSPTVTPAPTTTPAPTPSPVPTPLPPAINIEVDKQNIVRGECVQVKWTIAGVREVYFDYSDKELDPQTLPASNDNQDRTLERCDLTRTTTFLWRIVLSYGADGKADGATPQDDIVRVESRTVKVKAQPSE